jgi:hypothetical protein
MGYERGGIGRVASPNGPLIGWEATLRLVAGGGYGQEG